MRWPPPATIVILYACGPILNRDVRQDAMKFCYDRLSMAYDENLTLATLAPIIRTKTPGEQL